MQFREVLLQRCCSRDNKFIPEHLIRKQLHVDQEQFAGLHSCTVSKEAYIKTLIDKRIIIPNKQMHPQRNAAQSLILVLNFLPRRLLARVK